MQKSSEKTGDNGTKRLGTKVLVIVSSLMLLGVIGLVDYSTGRELSFGVFYFLPIWLITWYFSRRVAIMFSSLCALVWLLVEDLAGGQYSEPFIPYWNGAVRLAYFITFAILLSSVREQLRQSRREVKRLSSLLPICASCKKIRDELGNWQEIETYIRDHSDTDFSHGVCPDCAKVLYPEFSDELLKKWKQSGS